ncbi:hypothetical protein HaLaN_11376 [Haematococcus lacustris]|uniref:Uncharacterized protein n=1 Tax=Haematococcus lacustris TaxID=44745 RepID=A0A699YY38_HAELA|nr:hypothetical protein HaLaN_11376 [Haematococcus lacustris]
MVQGAALLPDHEAKVRLSLGRLLVNHSCNFKDAERELLRVQALVGQLLGSYLLKCEVCFLLGRNYRSQGDVTSQGCQAAGEAGLSQMQVVFMLFSLQLLLVVPDPKAFATRRRLTLDLIQALAPPHTGGAAGTPAQPSGPNGAGPGAGGQGQGGPAGGLVRAGSGQSWSTAEGSAAAGGAAEQLPEGFLAYANCQLSLLETPVQAAPGAPQGTQGGPQGLSPDSGGPAGAVKGRSQRHTLVAMASIRGMLDSTQGKAIGYHWLPLSSARALICLISAVLYAFTGKTQQAVDEITKGEAAVSEHLAELGVRHEE